MPETLRVLVLEDSETDYRLITRELRQAGFDVVSECVETEATLRQALATSTWDLIVADDRMPHLSALVALDVLRQQQLDIPLMVVSGTIGEEKAVELMRAGARDFFLKGHTARLPEAVERELREAAHRRQRRAAEAELARLYEEVRADRERFAVTLSSIGDAVIATDRAGHVTFMNAVAETLTGWTRPAAEGAPLATVFRIVNEHTREPVESPVDKVMREGTIVGLANHTVLLTKDGRDVPIDDSGAPIRDAKGDLIGIVLVFRDVSERKQTEAALIASEERLRLAVAATGLGIFDWDLTTDEVQVNARFRDILGLPPGNEIIGQAMLGNVVHPEDRPFVNARLAAAMDPHSEGRYQFEHRAVTPAGERWLLTIGQVYFTGEGAERRAVRVIGNELDITQRKRAEEALRANEARFRRALNIETVGVLFFDLDGRITNVNDAFLHMSGFDRADVYAGLRWDVLTPPEWMAASRQTAEMLQQTGQAPPYEKEYVRKDGSRWWGLFAPRMLDDREAVEFVLDISARKQLEAERAILLEREQTARREAERALSAQQLFLGMISHELRTPLTSIKGFASSLLATDVTFNGEQQQEFVRIIDQEADRLQDLVEQLLDVVQLGAGQLRITPTPERLPDIVASVMPQLQTLAAAHHLVIELPEALPAVRADKRRIGQVLVNLIGNAAKFSPADSVIALSASSRNGEVEVVVRDEGIGIPFPDQSRVFDVFQRGTATRRQNGAGLGLAICKGLVEAHGGRIGVEDRSGPGTTITFTVPLAAPPLDNEVTQATEP